ncbi:hypothetical protein JCM19379_22770 [Methyloparacoccus murrellii]
MGIELEHYLSATERAALEDDEVGAGTATGSPTHDAEPVIVEEIENATLLRLAESTATPAVLGQAITELVAAKDALESAYEAGDSELTYAEHRAKLREIDAALLDLNAERAEAGLVHRMAGEARQKDWRRQIEETRREAGRLGLDLKPGSELEAQWDRAVKYLGADPANNHRDAAWFLREALNMVAARHGKHPATRDDHRPGAGSRGAAPADLEGLKGLALEQALARMSPEQADQWLNS